MVQSGAPKGKCVLPRSALQGVTTTDVHYYLAFVRRKEGADLVVAFEVSGWSCVCKVVSSRSCIATGFQMSPLSCCMVDTVRVLAQ